MTLRPFRLGLTLLLGAVAASAQAPLEPTTFRLANGMTFLVFDQPEAVTVDAGWAVALGSGDDPPGLSGMAHLVEHMMFKGTATLAPGELDRLYARAGGGTPNAFTTADTTVYLVSLPAEKLELWFWLESDRLLHPAFRGLESEIGVIRQEQGQVLANPTAALDEAIDAAFFSGPAHRLSRFGAPGELEAVREEDLARFVAEGYRPEHLTAVLQGPLDGARVRELAERYFGRLPAGPKGSGPKAAAEPPAALVPPAGTPPATERRLALPASGPPRWVSRWATVPGGHADEPVLDLLVTLLNGRSGRLLPALVSPGLATRASADRESLRRGGWLAIRSEARPGVEGARIEEAVAGVLRRLAEEPVPAEELERARSVAAADALRRLSVPAFRLGRVLHAAALGDWRRPLDGPERLLAVTAEDLRRVVSTLLRPERRLVVEVGLAASKAAGSAEPQAPGRPVSFQSSFPRKRESRVGDEPKMDPRFRGDDLQEGSSELRSGLLPAAPPQPIPDRPEALLSVPYRPRLPDPRAHRSLLAGGVPLYLAEDSALPLAEVTLVLRVGDFLDPEGQAGLAAMTARAWRRGGTAGLKPADFDRSLERLGGRLTVTPGLASTAVTLNVLAANLQPALDLLFELLAHPAFDFGNLALEQRATFEAMLKRNDDAAVLGARTWDRLAYGSGHFAARLPTAAEVSRLDQAAVAGFQRRWWGPRNLLIAASGALNAGALDAEALVRRLEAGLAAWGSDAEPAPWPPPVPSGAAPPGWKLLELGGPQSWVSLGGPGLSWAGRWDDGQLYAAALAHEALVGGGFPSRLVARLRESEGLVYFPASEAGLGVAWPVPWQVRFQTRPESVERAIAVVRQELARLAAEPLPPAELDQAQASLLSRVARSLESRRERVVSFALDELQGRPLDFWPKAPERYAAVTPAQVQAASQQLYAEPAWVLEVGPAGTFAGAAAAAGASVEKLPLLEPMTLKPGG